MQKTTIEIKILENDLDTQVDPSDYDNVIFAESDVKLCTVSQITLSGKFKKTYTVLSHFIRLHDDLVLVDGDKLIICIYNEFAVVDLATDKVVKVINEDTQFFGIYKFKSGYFIHGEELNIFYDGNFDRVWKDSCGDIFFNSKVENDLEIHDDYIAAYGWYGDRHVYDETGRIKMEDHPEYSMS